MSAETGGTVEIGSMTITSSNQTPDEIRAAIADPAPTETAETEDDPSKAAAVLGRKGGEATAEKRKAEAKDAKREAKKRDDAVEPVPADGGDTGGDDVDDGTKPAGSVDGKPLGNPRHDPRARVHEATREAAEAKREAQAERQRAETAERRLAEVERRARTVEEPPAPPKDRKPVLDDFETHDEYLDARDAYNRKVWSEEEAEKRQRQAGQQRMHGYIKRFSDAVADSAKSQGLTVADFYAKVSPEIMLTKASFQLQESDPPPDGRTWIADEIVDNSEHAPALMLHLSEHPDDYQRIAALQTPRQVTREMARLVTRLDGATTATTTKPTVSKATAPARSVTGSPVTDSRELDDTAPLSAFVQRHGERELRSNR